MSLQFTINSPATRHPTPSPQPGPNLALRQVAEDLEASFLSEMLRSAGVGQIGAFGGAFSGGVGEEHFASFLLDAQAREIVRAGGIGLAALIESSLAERGHARPHE